MGALLRLRRAIVRRAIRGVGRLKASKSRPPSRAVKTTSPTMAAATTETPSMGEPMIRILIAVETASSIKSNPKPAMRAPQPVLTGISRSSMAGRTELARTIV